MSSAFSVHGSVSVETRRATEDLRAFQTQLEGTANQLEALLKNKKSVSVGVNARPAQDALQDLAKEAERSSRKAADVVSRETARAARDQVRAAQGAQREQEKLARQSEARAQKSAREQARDQDKAAREALRKQKEFGAAWGREIDATMRREGMTLNRFGERVRTVTGLLSDIEKGFKNVHVGFKVDPRGDLKTLRRQLEVATRTAGGVPLDFKTGEGKVKLLALHEQLKGLQGAAKISVEIDQKGEVKGLDARGDAGNAAEALKKQVEDAAQARSEILEKISTIATVSGASITASMGLAANAAVNFDAALRNVNTIAQLSEPQLKKLGDAILNVSFDPKIRQDAQDLVGAMNAIYSSGYKGAKALDILKESAIGASAGQTDTATSSKVLMAVLSSGIPGVKTAHQAMDVLFKTVDQGVLTFGDLAGSLGAILPTAATAKIPLQQIGAAIAVMTQKGQSGSEAVNDLLNLVSKIANPSQGAAKAFKEMGISFGFSGLAAKGLPGILAQIQSKTKGSADEIKKLLPDMQAQRAALSLLANGGKAYTAALQGQNAASQGTGASMRALSKANQGVSTDVARSQKEFKNLSILAGQTVVPALSSVLKSVSGLFKWFNELPRATQENIVKFTAYAGVGLLLLGRLKSLIDTFALLKMAFFGARAATVAATGATVANTAANARLGTSLVAVRARLIATSATSVAASSRMALAFKGIGVPLLAITATIWGVRTAILGTRDAGVMSAERLIEKWGALGRVWVAGGNALGGLISKLNGTAAASDKADAALADFNRRRAAAKASGKPMPKSDVWKAAHGSHAKGLDRVPFDGYRAELHKGEAVLTAEQAAVWRSEQARSRREVRQMYADFERQGIGRAPGSSSTSAGARASAPIITDAILASVSTSKSISNCANVAGQILKKMGVPITRDNYAQNLARNASRIAPRIPISQASAGDLIVWNDPARYGARQKNLGGRRSGYHVAVAAGDDRWVGNRGGKHQGVQSGRIYDRAHAYAYDTSALARGGEAGSRRLTPEERASAHNERSNRRRLGDDVFAAGRGEVGDVMRSISAIHNKTRSWVNRGKDSLQDLVKKDGERTQAAQEERSRISFDKHLLDLEKKLRLESAVEDVIARRLDLERYEHDLQDRQEKGDLNAAQANALGAAFKSRQAAQAALDATTRQIEATARVGEAWSEMGEDVASSIDAAMSKLVMSRKGFPQVGDFSKQEDLPDLAADRWKGFQDRLADAQQGRDDVAQAARDQRGRVRDFLADAQNRAAQAMERDPIAREILDLKSQLTRDGWSEGDIQKVLPTFRWSRDVEALQGKIEGVMGNIESTFGSAFDRLYDEGPKGFFDELQSGLRQTLKSMASQILASAAKDWIGNLFGGLIGRALGGSSARPMGASAGLPTGWHAPMALPGHATGLDFVPRNDYVARLHRGEAVLNARAAEQWRNQDRATALAGAAGGSRGGSGAGASTSSTTVINNSYNIGTIRANDPQEFTKQLPGRQLPASAQRASLRRALGST